MKLFNNIFLVACLLLSSQFISASADKQFTAYFQSWSEKWSDKGSGLTLANLPPYVNTVIISFFKPDNSYSSGSLSLANTGLDFSSDASVVKDAIAAAKSNGAKVLVAVGGATYTNWDGLNANGVGAFVKDFGLDGVDVDFEPANAGCTQNGGSVSCSTDQQFQKIVQDLRSAVPQPAILSMAGWSIGAYGEGDFSSAQPQGANTGLSVNLLKSDAGKSLDQINVMSYDAGPTFDPKQAFQAYKSLFKGKVVLGVEVPPEAWGGHVLSINELDGLCDYVNQNGGDGDGMMLWSLNKKPDGGASASNPDATMISQEVCKKFGLKSCDSPLPTMTGIPEDAEVEEVIVALNAEKNMWLSHSMRGEAMARYMSTQKKQENENVLDALKLLVDGLSDQMEQYFGERAQELGEMIANLDSHKDALWNRYLEDFMMASQYVKNSDPRGVTYVFDNKSGASIKVLTPLKFSEDDLVNEKGMAEAIADWNAKKNVWLSHYLRGQAMASYMSNQNDQKNEESNKQDNNSLESLKGMLTEQYFKLGEPLMFSKEEAMKYYPETVSGVEKEIKKNPSFRFGF